MTPSDSFVQHRATLLRRVAELQERQPSLRFYALVETGLHSELPKLYLQLADRTVALFDGTPEHSLASHSPRLIDLSSEGPGQPMQASLMNQLVELACTSPCVSWLVSSEDLTVLACHLRQWLGAKLLDTDGSELGEVLVRFTDPRVLPGFMDMLTPQQYGDLMRSITLWGVWLRSHRWREWTPPEINPPRSVPPMQSYTLRQQAMLDRATRVDRVQALIEDQLAMAEVTDPAARRISQDFFSLPPDSRFQQLDRILARSARYQISADADWVVYAWLALGIHEHFDDDEDIRAAIEREVRNGASFAQAVSRIPQDMWDRFDAWALRDSRSELQHR